ncbi:MAG TPA: PilC/PilY family type IV pilus protein [Gammaproteobacteria bacterium]|nr:PilC/PilY family type IV pilus protein [Gammaproteobacteria bacterium]
MKVETRRSAMLRRLGAGMAAFALSLLSVGPASANVSIANSPLFVTSSADPNILFIIDDSGSMQWETMPDALTNIFSAGCCTNYMMWVYPRTAGLHGGGDYDGIRVPSFATTSIMGHVYRSALVNTVYYNPGITYLPWANADGSRMPNASPTAAPNRPLFPGYGTRNLTVNNTQAARWVENRTNADVNATRTFFPAVYSTYTGPAIADLNAAINDAASPLWTIANYQRTEIIPANAPFTGEGRVNRSDCTAGSCTYDQEIQNFANWYSYHRNRIFASRAGIGSAFSVQPESMRVGLGAINTTGTVIRGVRPFAGTDRTAFFDDLYRQNIPPQGTPLRLALDGAGQYFSRTDDLGPWSSTPGEAGGVDLECRQSYSILMTDGSASGTNTYAAAGTRRDNNDGSGSNSMVINNPAQGGSDYTYTPTDPFQDGRSNTLADVAMYYWKRDLRPDLPNLVPTTETNPAFWQHMVTFGVGLGVSGTIDPATAFAAIETGTPIAWPDPEYGTTNCTGAACLARSDDVLHAAVNSRGGFFNAKDPEEFAIELASVLEDIVARVESSATSAATSSAVLQTDTLLYTAGFRSGDWSGRLDARAVNEDGSLGGQVWDAEVQLALKTPAARNIVTRRSDTGVAVTFQFANLSAAQQAALNRDPSGVNDGLGAQRVAWLRGDDNAHGSFRSRLPAGGTAPNDLRLLGDIVNSNPKFQDGVLYVGANDGMLHAFNAETGEELFAYVPSPMLVPEGSDTFAPVSRLMDPDYTHRYFVDGTVSVVDLSVAGTPRKVLVGSLGAGGRTVFALDVTNPASFGPADVLWEFSHPELGYNVGPPGIVRLSDGTMAAVFGNGYNSTSHRAMLFAVNMNTGALIQTVDTGVGSAGNPNGLASPVITDWPVSNLRANRVYAGDLQGNLWRFSVGGAPANWNDAGNVNMLFTAIGPSGSRQPITAQPIVALNPVNSNEVVVAFGTGSYFRTDDQDMPGAAVQSLYGIIDTRTGASGVLRADLLEQEVTSQSVETFGGETVGVRIVSDNDFDASLHDGWYLDLDVEDGERVISEGTYPSGPLQRRVRFSTLIPDENPCGTGRRGYIMDLDIISGGRTRYSVFDLNRDGNYDDLDQLGGEAVSGVAWGQGERPTVLTPGDTSGDPPEFLYTGEGEYIRGLGEEGIGGRQSWQQLR